MFAFFLTQGQAGPASRILRAARVFLGVPMLFAFTVSHAQVRFDDVTDGSGLEYDGESYGASWGDMNNDGYPDLAVTHHRNPSSLYVNRGNGNFVDRRAGIDAWQATPRSDVHGATWADYNNDGRLDLFVTAGSKNYSQFLVNDGTTLSDRIHDFDFDSQSWGGRYPFWFDYDNDGLLDLGVVVQGGKVHLHQQAGGEFIKQNFASGHQCTNGDFSLLSDLTMDGRVEWVCVNTTALPERIYDLTGGMPFPDETALATRVGNIADVAVADFDGDLLMELFALRGKVRLNGAALTAPRKIEAHFSTINAQAAGFTFRSSGDLTVELHWSGQKVNSVFIGASGMHPPAAAQGEPIRMQLSASDPNVHGLMSYDPASNNGIYIGYDPASQTWTFANSAGGSKAASSTYSFLTSTAAVSDLDDFGVPNAHRPVRPALLKYAGSQYTNQVKGTGLDRNELCVSVAAADFDNDMDVDLYYVCRDAVLNIANKLYLNDGTGRFTPASAPNGAEGPVGAGVGLGETVAASDYDVDGFVDLFVTNGLGLFPEEPYGHGGPDRLYRNRGNGNRWIELDLTGVASNRDGIGAIVTVTAGGKSQRREQTGGYHRWAQHDARLHFGLAANQSANVTVLWPSGQQDVYTNVAANRLYEATEGGAKLRAVTPGAAPLPDCLQVAGTPPYDKNADRAVFLWRESCSSQNWHVRVTGGAGPTLQFSGKLASSGAITNATPVLFEPNDVLALSGDGRELDFVLNSAAGGQDGFSFTVNAAAESCFGVGSSVGKVYVGANETPMDVPFDLQTLAACGP
ncbi:MAG TPA: CRTAC1 family protein [Woeseiaceae bacterium]|nr:CRTAC1 family protein [Woeseiaceae bacterium]